MKNTFFKNNHFQLDSLTKLYDRQAIVDFSNYLIQNNTPFSLALIDIDNFKNVNDSFGHAIGDRVICLMADKIKEAYGDKGVVGRFGGDEFIIVVPEIVEYDEVWSLCREVFRTVDGVEADALPGLYVTVTLGLSRFNQDANNYEKLMETADKALYRGKVKGRSCFIIYLAEKHANIQLKSSNDLATSSMQLHNQIFRILSRSENLAENIKLLLQQFSATMMIDHIGIQSVDRLIFSDVYSLSRGKEFYYIDNDLIEKNVSPGMSIFYQNDVKQLSKLKQDKLCNRFKEQGIFSTFYGEISYGDKFYGYLRCDSTSCMRIWQYNDMDLLLTASKTIGMILHFQNKELNDLVSE